MTKNINYVSHKKSKVKNNGKPQLPSANSLVEGEIAINYAKDVETLSIKNESGTVVTFSSDNYYTEKKLGSGFTESNSAVTVTSAMFEIEKAISDEASRATAAESALSSGKANKATTLAGYGITDAYTKSQTYTKTEVNGLVDTPHQNYVTVATYADLPTTGSADTIYRVSNWDGSANSGAGAVDVTVYSEYAWDGSQYIFLCVKSQIGEVFDITVYNNNTKYDTLADALGTNGANIPQSLRKGGMSVKYVQTSDNKYVQYRLMATAWSTVVTDWQGVDDEPTAGSNNLVKSGGVINNTGIVASIKNFEIHISDRIQYIVNATNVNYGKFLYITMSKDIEAENPNVRIVTKDGNTTYGYIKNGLNRIEKESDIIDLQIYYSSSSIESTISMDVFALVAAELRSHIDSEFSNVETNINDKHNNSLLNLGNLSKDVLKDFYYLTSYISYEQKGLIHLFDSNDINVGEQVEYKLELDSSTTSGYNLYIELLDSSDNRLAVYGKTSSSGDTSIWNGAFSIPQGFSYAILDGSGKGCIHYLKRTNKFYAVVDVVTSGTSAFSEVQVPIGKGTFRIELPNFQDITSVSGEICKIVRIGASGTIFSIQKGEIYTKNQKFVDYVSPSDGNLKIQLKDSENLSHIFRIAKCEYGRPDFEETNDEIFSIEQSYQDIDIDNLKYSDGETTGVLGKCILINNKIKNTDVEIFSSSQVTEGERIDYKISVNSQTTNGYNAYIELLDSNNTRIAIYGKTSVVGSATTYSGNFLIPSGFSKAILSGSAKAELNYICKHSVSNATLLANITNNKSVTDASIAQLSESISHIEGVTNINAISHVAFAANPITLLANNDAEATALDNLLINFSSIVKLSDELFFLYYSCEGTDSPSGSGDGGQFLCFAYSTDGFTYTRGCPPGIQEPVQGTNKLFDFHMREHCACIVNDSDYPIRLLGNTNGPDNTQVISMYKSADGVHFVKVRDICLGADTQMSVISRGNILKVYKRSYGMNGRSIGIMYCDIFGNILSPSISAFDWGTDVAQPYNAAASLLDDHREILFPTLYYPSTSLEELRCVIVNGERYDEVSIDASNLIGDNKSMYVVPGLINIGRDMYIACAVRNTDHEQTSQIVSKLIMTKVTLT